MRNWPISCLLFTSLSVEAQGFLKDFSTVNRLISQQEIDKYLKKPTHQGLPGSFFNPMLPLEAYDGSQVCPVEEDKSDVDYEIIMVAQSAQGGPATVETQEYIFHQLDRESLMRMYEDTPQNENSTGLSRSAIMNRSQDVWNRDPYLGWEYTDEDGPGEPPGGGTGDYKGGYRPPVKTKYNPHTTVGREIFIESLVHAAGESKLPEQEVARQMAQTINSVYTSEEDRYNFLSAYSSRLYRNYNTPRNPGLNNEDNNPKNIPLPEGDLSLQDINRAAANFIETEGGVCNDISENVALVGEYMFPDKDVLVINGETHFGVVVADENGNRVIDAGQQYQMQNHLALKPDSPASNLRINKVINGQLKEIAVVDTQMGELTEEAFQTGKKLLKTSADIGTVVGQVKVFSESKAGQVKEGSLAVGKGAILGSEVVVVVAKYESRSKAHRSYMGIGGTAQDVLASDITKYQVHFRAGTERRLFHYVSSKVAMRLDTGVRLEGMYNLSQEEGSIESTGVSMSLGLDWFTRAQVQYGQHNPQGIQVNAQVQVDTAAAPDSWGRATGAVSKVTPGGVMRVLGDTSFHLNQVSADVNAEKRLTPGLKVTSSLNYQGSNIGQSAGGLAGLDIKAPAGAQILVFAGYHTSKLPGYMTKHSLLVAPNGGMAGVALQDKNGVRVQGVVRGIGSQNISGDLGISIPLGSKKK